MRVLPFRGLEKREKKTAPKRRRQLMFSVAPVLPLIPDIAFFLLRL